jgi:hypothetical protein
MLKRLAPNRWRGQLFQLFSSRREGAQRQQFRAANPQDTFIDIVGELVDLHQQTPRVDLQIAQVVQVRVIVAQQFIQGPPLALQDLAHPGLDRLPCRVGHGMGQLIADVLNAAVRIPDVLPFFLQFDRLIAVFGHFAFDERQPRTQLGDVGQLLALIAQYQADSRGQPGGLHFFDRIALIPSYIVEPLGLRFDFTGDLGQLAGKVRPFLREFGVTLSQLSPGWGRSPATHDLVPEPAGPLEPAPGPRSCAVERRRPARLPPFSPGG